METNTHRFHVAMSSAESDALKRLAAHYSSKHGLTISRVGAIRLALTAAMKKEKIAQKDASNHG